MISKLSQEQEADMIAHLDKWLTIAGASGPCDRDAIEAAARQVYAGVGVEFPPIKIWMSSPIGGIFAATFLDVSRMGERFFVEAHPINKFKVDLESELLGQLGKDLATTVQARVLASLVSQRHAVTHTTLLNQVTNDVARRVEVQLSAILKSQFGFQLWSQLQNDLGNSTSSQINLGPSDVNDDGSSLDYRMWNTFGKYLSMTFSGQNFSFWVAWMAFIRDTLGASLTADQSQWTDGIIGMCGSGSWFPLSGAVVFTERPDELHRDAQGRLHAEQGMAMRYADGWGLWSIHGVEVNEQIVLRPETLSVNDILTNPNVEQRRVAIERFGWDRFIAEASLRLVDDCPDPANAPYTLSLYDVPEQLYEAPVRLLLCTNASPERDGTRRRYGLTVPIEIDTALSAVAWSFESSPEAYERLARAS